MRIPRKGSSDIIAGVLDAAQRCPFCVLVEADDGDILTMAYFVKRVWVSSFFFMRGGKC